MKKSNNTNRTGRRTWVKGEFKATIKKAVGNEVLLLLTDRKVGYKTMVKLDQNALERIANALKDFKILNSELRTEVLEFIPVKQQEYVSYGDGFKYRYFMTQEAVMRLVAVGEYVTISLHDKENGHIFYSIPARAEEFIELGHMIEEYMFNQNDYWL